MNTPPPLPESETLKLAWYEQIWLALPFVLIAVGGAVGGACGGAAWAINQKVFRATQQPVLRYLWTALISAGALVSYLILASLFLSLLGKGK